MSADPETVLLVAFLAIALSFTLSASAGMGGSLVLVPALSLLLGARHGIAVSALLLAGNNVAKVIAYRKTIPLRPAFGVLILTMAGAGIGAGLMVSCPESWLHVGVVVAMLASLLVERRDDGPTRLAFAPALAFLAGATSGFAGTSGPLKGLALRNLALDRLYFVGAASVVSLGGDAIKAAVFLHADVYSATTLPIVIGAIPLMPIATYVGRNINRRIGERGYSVLFWAIMGGYAVRLFVR